MTVYRLYATPDGESHIDEGNVYGPNENVGKEPLVGTKGIVFRQDPKAIESSWHNAPRRQYVIVMDGWMDITPSVGKKRRLNKGDAVLAEDLAGKGHKTKISAGRKTMFIHLEDLKPGA